MGHFDFIERNPKRWHVQETSYVLKPEYGGDKLVKVEYGEWTDDFGVVTPLECYMRAPIWERCSAGELSVEPKIGAGFFVLRDIKTQEIIKPLTEWGFCY